MAENHLSKLCVGSWWVKAPYVEGDFYRLLEAEFSEVTGADGHYIHLKRARSLLGVILIVLVVRAFVWEPFRIPSPSMMPTLMAGDVIIVNKHSYELKVPIVNIEILTTGTVRRGDVVVFGVPSTHSTTYVKRVIGLPGDHIVVRDNRLAINGELIPLEAFGVYTGGHGFVGSNVALERLNQEEHAVLLLSTIPPLDFDGTVPAGHYFVMGDNRNASTDSRSRQVGFIGERDLIGRATWIALSWRFSDGPNWSRVGMKIR